MPVTRNIDQGVIHKVLAEVFEGGLLFRDPRRSDSADQWVCLPVHDEAGISRGSERNVVKTHVHGRQDRELTIGESTVSIAPASIDERPLSAIARLTRLRAEIDAELERQVRLARAPRGGNGWAYAMGRASWQEVGEALGVSGQAAGQKYGAKR